MVVGRIKFKIFTIEKFRLYVSRLFCITEKKLLY